MARVLSFFSDKESTGSSKNRAFGIKWRAFEVNLHSLERTLSYPLERLLPSHIAVTRFGRCRDNLADGSMPVSSDSRFVIKVRPKSLIGRLLIATI